MESGQSVKASLDRTLTACKRAHVEAQKEIESHLKMDVGK